RLRGAHQVGDFKGHPISYQHRVTDLWSPGRIVVGEAGRMTHPATAEGIYQGMRSGIHAAEALASVARADSTEGEAFGKYQRRCRAAFGASFLAAKLVQKVLASPIPDLVAGAGQSTLVRRVTGRVMAQM